MIQLDDRRGSGELERYFLPYGIQVKKCRLTFGDMAWVGKGPKNMEVGVVVERKRIEDLIQSMTSKRLAGHQLPGICDEYDYGYLLIDGIWKPTADSGAVTISNGPGRWQQTNISSRQVNNFVMGLNFRAGLTPWRVSTKEELVSFVVDQYLMWQKPWEEHKAHDQVYAPADRSEGRKLFFRQRKVDAWEKAIMQLPGIDSKAKDMAKKFSNIDMLAAASQQDLMDAGLGIGKVGAKRIWEALHK